jgi:hypothetical protein
MCFVKTCKTRISFNVILHDHHLLVVVKASHARTNRKKFKKCLGLLMKYKDILSNMLQNLTIKSHIVKCNVILTS